MAGHSQFKNIMHRKGAQDAKRARMFARLSREITVAAKSGIPEPASNPRLRSAIAAARQANMPKDKIDAAIKKATSTGEGENYEEVRYEGYGPGGIAVIVEVLTDNRNRSAAEIRSTFSRYGGNMGESGSVSFMFERVGMVKLPKSGNNFDAVFDAAVDLGADNVEEQEDGFEITCHVDHFAAVRDGVHDKFGDTSEAKVIWRPLNTVECGEQQAASLLKFMDVLDDNDDVQNVYANFEIPDEVMEKIMS